MKVIIKNEGLLDVNQLIYMGCSDKNGVTTIGKFGTGLKYAIAVFCRLGIDFNIYIGKNKIPIYTESKLIGHKNYDTVVINHIKTSYTTSLGVEWELWQAVREFIANAMDMRGFYSVGGSLNLSDSSTTIEIDFDQISETLDKFCFDGWIEVDKGLFYKEKSEKGDAKIFKEGFLVYEGEESSFDYRIDFLKINEARVAEDRREVKTYIGKIQSLMGKKEVEILVENEEFNLGYIFENNKLSNAWLELSSEVVKNISGGFDLRKAIYNNIAESKGDTDIASVKREWIKISKDVNLKYEFDSKYNVYLQNTKDSVSSKETGWDISKDCSDIIIWVSDDSYTNYLDGETNEEIIEEYELALEYMEGLEYVTKNNLKTASDTAVNFLRILKGMNQK